MNRKATRSSCTAAALLRGRACDTSCLPNCCEGILISAPPACSSLAPGAAGSDRPYRRLSSERLPVLPGLVEDRLRLLRFGIEQRTGFGLTLDGHLVV